MYFIDKFLPKRGLVLDGGSGPGKYTVELTKRGNTVIALDPVEKSLRFLRKAVEMHGAAGRLKGVVNGRLEDLSRFKDNTFDGVISLGGPMSHIMDERLRKRAAAEILRVAKPRARIFVSVMSRMSMIDGFVTDFQKDLDSPYSKAWVKTGDYFGGYGFTAFHGFLPGELSDLFDAKTFKKITMVGIEGFGSRSEKKLARLQKNKSRWKGWLKMHLETAEEPSIIGVSEHIMLIGEKKAH